MGGGAWPFLVRGVICLVNSDNERDSNILNRCWQEYSAEALHTDAYLLVLYVLRYVMWSYTCWFVLIYVNNLIVIYIRRDT